MSNNNNNGLLSKVKSIFFGSKANEAAAFEERLQLVNARRVEQALTNEGNEAQAIGDGIDLSILNDDAALLYNEVQGQTIETNALTQEAAAGKERNRMMRKLLQKAEETELALLAAQEAFTATVYEEEDLNLQVALKRQKAASILDAEVSKALPDARATLRAKAREAAEAKMAARLSAPPICSVPAAEEGVNPPKKGKKSVPPTPPATTAEEALKALTAALAKANFSTTNAQALVGATEVAHLGLGKADLAILACAKTVFKGLKWQPSLWEKLDVAAEGERRAAAKSPAGTVSGIDLTAEGDDDAPVVGATSTPLGDAKGPEKTAPGTL